MNSPSRSFPSHHQPPRNAQPCSIVLTGFMGTGKSTVGRLLATRLGRTFIDTDAAIEQRHGPIADIFETEGEGAFRRYERALAEELALRTDLVIATGGGMLVDPHIADRWSRTAEIVCLTAPVGQILDRVLNDPSPVERPLLAGDDPAGRIATLLSQRAEAYARFRQVETGGRLPDEIVDHLVLELRLDDGRTSHGA